MNRSVFNKFDVIVVGAGFFGCTVARELANMKKKVLLLERRGHVGGNAYSYFDVGTGIEVPKYGSHIFHTNSEDIWNYIKQFSGFNNYIHKVVSKVEDRYVPIPINLETINQIFHSKLNSDQAREFVASITSSETLDNSNLENWALRKVGRVLYENLVRGYSKKQWEIDPRELPASTIARLPIRFDANDRYFDDSYQGMPSEGYEKLFWNMLDAKEIKIEFNTEFNKIYPELPSNKLIIYSGPIDRFFDYNRGILNWRTLDFEYYQVGTDYFQSHAVINFPDEKIPFTRCHEFKHYYPERNHSKDKTIIAYEYSRRADISDEPFYPVNTESDKQLLSRYREQAQMLPNVYFGGRLGSYQYLDMHMAINQALKLVRELQTTRWN